MKTLQTNITTIIALLGVTIAFQSCERELSSDAEFATFPNTAQVFTDVPVGLSDDFFVSFDPAQGANTNGFGTDNTQAFQGTTSIRIDVPTPNDPDGGFIGGIFRDRGEGRNLTEYDALTFWAKGSTTATIGTVGFGVDFMEDKFPVNLPNIELSTDWRKYIIPIPDASKLIQERGMFVFSAGTQSTNGNGFTFWMDEIQFETLGTIGQNQPSILGGAESNWLTSVGETLALSQLNLRSNLPNGINQTTIVSPQYFSFQSSNPSVAIVNELGEVTVLGEGTAEITATLAGVLAEGKLIVEAFDAAPVISIFSDLYANVPVDYYNGFFTPDGQTTQGGVVEENGEQIINYTQLNFVGIGFFQNVPTIDASAMTHMHVEIRVNESIDPGDFINLQLLNSVGNNETSGIFGIPGTDLQANEWVSFDIPLSSFTGLGARDALGLLFFISDTTISNISVDNIFFFSE